MGYSERAGGGGGLLCGPSVHLTGHLGNSVPSGAGTGRLHLEQYQVFKNKGMCFPFAADLSTEILSCSGVANIFTRDSRRVFLISSPLSLADFLCVKRTHSRENKGKNVSAHTYCSEQVVRVVRSLRGEVISAHRVCAVLRSAQSRGPLRSSSLQ